jgi:hypothetical protein
MGQHWIARTSADWTSADHRCPPCSPMRAPQSCSNACSDIPRKRSNWCIKLNFGAGHSRIAGWLNGDGFAACDPDLALDLEAAPWPYETSAVASVLFNHCLEHMGAEPRIFLAFMSELWRVRAPRAEVDIRVPHPRHENTISDATHDPIISPTALSLFDRRLNDEWTATRLRAHARSSQRSNSWPRRTRKTPQTGACGAFFKFGCGSRI